MSYSGRRVSVYCVFAVALWVITVGFLVGGSLVAIAKPGESGLAVGLSLLAYGLACSAAAATMSIRTMLENHSQIIDDAFDLGREAGGGNVRRVR